MGLYDREYYREEHARREAWQFGPVTIGLITLSLFVFFAQLATLDRRRYGSWADPLLYWGGFSTDKILDGEVWRLATSLLLHHPFDNIWLFIASLVVLAYCGRGVEGTYGPKEMFWFYVASGLISQLGLLAIGLARPMQFLPPEPGYGCGGPVAAVMVLYARLAPEDRVPLLLGSVRAGVLATILVLVNIGLFASTNGRYFTAIPVLSGAAFALAYHRFGWRVSNGIPDIPGLRRSAPIRQSLKSRPMPLGADLETPEPKTPPPAPIRKGDSTVEAPALNQVDEQLEVELDRVLGKVGKSGKASLTPEENALLLRASEVYKMKRR